EVKPAGVAYRCYHRERKDDAEGEDDIPAPEPKPGKDEGRVLGDRDPGDDRGEEGVDDRDDDKVDHGVLQVLIPHLPERLARAEEKAPYLVGDPDHHPGTPPLIRTMVQVPLRAFRSYTWRRGGASYEPPFRGDHPCPGDRLQGIGPLLVDSRGGEETGEPIPLLRWDPLPGTPADRLPGPLREVEGLCDREEEPG